MNEYLLEEVAAVVVVLNDKDAKASQRLEAHGERLPPSNMGIVRTYIALASNGSMKAFAHRHADNCAATRMASDDTMPQGP